MSVVYLERPDLFKPSLLQPLAKHRAKFLLEIGQEADRQADYQPNIAILVRTKNDIAGLERFSKHIAAERENYKGRIDLVVVDTESNDGTKELAHKFNAKVIDITQAEFTYPNSINLGLAEIQEDVEATFITVGHAEPVLSNCLKGGVRHFKDPKVVGVWTHSIPGGNASNWERLFGIRRDLIRTFSNKDRVHYQESVTLGTLGATNCMIRMEAWHRHKFDNAYARGGEDTAWARSLLKEGHCIVYDPVLSVHHSHGLKLAELYKQIRHWQEIYSAPGEFSHDEIQSRRPDMR